MSNTPKTDHAYDGIEEFDNPLPGWWKWLFIGTIAFSPLYWVYYHGGASGRSVADQYEISLADNARLQFAEMGDLTPDADTIMRATTKDSWVSMGKSVFKTHCISCHGREGQGQVGPNLTDEHYKNVNQVADIAKVVIEGAGNGAMPKWSNRLHPNEIVLVSAYVATMRGQNLDGRPPEGKKIGPWPEPPAEEPEPEVNNPNANTKTSDATADESSGE